MKRCVQDRERARPAPGSWIVPAGLVLLAAMLLSACVGNGIPERKVDFDKPAQAVRAYLDYLRLEKAGVETVRMESRYYNRTVSLSIYLFTIAQAFEKFNRDNDAAKLYLRLLINYPLIYEKEQLGVEAENRLKWILGDKSWMSPTADELILRIEKTIITRNGAALKQVISRDFGLGRTRNERYAVPYEDALAVMTGELPDIVNPTVEVVDKTTPERMVLKVTGWRHHSKTWYLVLHKNLRLNAWEWDLAYWE